MYGAVAGQGGGIASFIPLILLAVIVVTVVGGVLRRGGNIRISGPTLVLRKFRVEESSPDGVVIEIVGRTSGLMAWLLTKLGFDAETRLKVTESEISFKSGSLFGQMIQTAPLTNISSTHCGYSKPIWYLILGGIFIIGGIGGMMENGIGALISGLIIGGIFLFLYWLSKKMTMSFETSGGIIMGLIFKRSVIENVAVDIHKAEQAIEIINKKVIEAQSKM